MIQRKQAKLLDALFVQVCGIKGMKAAEELLQSLLADDVSDIRQLNSYLSSYLEDDAYVIKYLGCKDPEVWLNNFRDHICTDFIKRYEEVQTWKPI